MALMSRASSMSKEIRPYFRTKFSKDEEYSRFLETAFVDLEHERVGLDVMILEIRFGSTGSVASERCRRKQATKRPHLGNVEAVNSNCGFSLPFVQYYHLGGSL